MREDCFFSVFLQRESLWQTRVLRPWRTTAIRDKWEAIRDVILPEKRLTVSSPNKAPDGTHSTHS